MFASYSIFPFKVFSNIITYVSMFYISLIILYSLINCCHVDKARLWASTRLVLSTPSQYTCQWKPKRFWIERKPTWSRYSPFVQIFIDLLLIELTFICKVTKYRIGWLVQFRVADVLYPQFCKLFYRIKKSNGAFIPAGHRIVLSKLSMLFFSLPW